MPQHIRPRKRNARPPNILRSPNGTLHTPPSSSSGSRPALHLDRCRSARTATPECSVVLPFALVREIRGVRANFEPGEILKKSPPGKACMPTASGHLERAARG
jgi:hypothetical protein